MHDLLFIEKILIPDVVFQASISRVGRKIIPFVENERFQVVARAFRCLQLWVSVLAFAKPELLRGQKLSLKILFYEVYYYKCK